MRHPSTPAAWANMLVQLWGPRFPVKVPTIALEYSRQFDDPVHAVVPADIPTFEGALLPHESGWAILYNSSSPSQGRVNFTLGHELGHYLCHRRGSPLGFQCGPADTLGVTRDIEKEADRFASYLLMPLNDFRAQVTGQHMGSDLLRHCADRYEVSLTAAALKWLEATDLCAVVVVGTSGHIHWFRRSAAAERARIFYRSGTELPEGSVAARGESLRRSNEEAFSTGVWGRMPGREVAIFADRYEMSISLIVFDEEQQLPLGWEDEEVEDAFDRMVARR